MLTRRRLVAAAAAATALAPALGRAQGQWPNRPLTLIVPWAAGGGTDATARIIASLLEKELGQPVNVVNRTGGGGVVGHSAIATAAPDGYSLGIVTVEIGMMHWVGLTDLDGTRYTPICLYNSDAAGLQIKADSPHRTAQDLVAAIKDNPGKLKASGTGQGGIWHLALAGWLNSLGIKPETVPWVPSQGAAPAMQDLAAGGVDMVTCSVPEARAMLDAGRARSLAIMSEKRLPAFASVPTLKEATGSDWTVAAWRGVAGPPGLPKAIVDRLVPILKKIHDGAEFRDFMASRGFGLEWGEPAAFARFMADSDAKMGAAMKAAGIARA